MFRKKEWQSLQFLKPSGWALLGLSLHPALPHRFLILVKPTPLSFTMHKNTFKSMYLHSVEKALQQHLKVTLYVISNKPRSPATAMSVQLFLTIYKSISNGAQNVTLDSKIKCQVQLFFLGNPTNKTEIAYTWGTTNSKPPGPITIIDQL